ncbi:MAG: helix-turn-helix transcriptional regulator [Robiginitomaculum sp.]|nr:helix-turn-helix transcriptional regulator [Robiginitomaculum sp.]
MSNPDMEIIRGSGNVYADFNDPDAQTKQMKAYLAANIIATLDDLQLTVRDAAKRTGITAADISRIRNADLGRFTLDRLVRVLGHLGQKVEMQVHEAA